MSFLQVYFNGELQFTAPLQPGGTTIGRAGTNDVVIDNPGISGHHAVIERDGDTFYLKDINSTNGVYLNGRRISRERLRYGDEITLFKHKLKLIAVDLSMNPGTGDAALKQGFISQDQTMEVNAAQLQAIMQHQQSHAPYLEQTGGQQQGRKWALSRPHFTIGKSPACDLRIGGWFAPKQVAKITRQSDGYYLNPEKKGRISLNGQPLHQRVKLRNLDKLQIRDIALTYYQPASTKNSGV
jgi:pSer/pThr/pTyr-binding forkhead associated (FHA) protein